MDGCCGATSRRTVPSAIVEPFGEARNTSQGCGQLSVADRRRRTPGLWGCAGNSALSPIAGDGLRASGVRTTTQRRRRLPAMTSVSRRGCGQQPSSVADRRRRPPSVSHWSAVTGIRTPGGGSVPESWRGHSGPGGADLPRARLDGVDRRLSFTGGARACGATAARRFKSNGVYSKKLSFCDRGARCRAKRRPHLCDFGEKTL